MYLTRIFLIKEFLYTNLGCARSMIIYNENRKATVNLIVMSHKIKILLFSPGKKIPGNQVSTRSFGVCARFKQTISAM